jgi:hypothetical protein
MPRTRGGEWPDGDIKSVREQNVDVLIALLTEDEVSELDLLHEADAWRSEGIRIPDVSRPAPWPSQHGRPDRKVYPAHRRMGVGRCALIAACVLIANSISADQVWGRLESAGGCGVPDTQEQKKWAHALPELIQKG